MPPVEPVPASRPPGTLPRSTGAAWHHARAFLPPLALALLFVGLNWVYVLADDCPKFTDHQFVGAWSWYLALRDASPPALGPGHLGPPLWGPVSSIHYPPFAYLVSQPFFLGGDPTMERARLSIAPFGLIYILSMFGIGQRLGGRNGGWAVALLACASPFTLHYSREYVIDFPQTAMTAASLWLLMVSEGFARRAPSALFGVAVGLAMITKWSALFYLAGPLGLSLIWVLSRPGKLGLPPVLLALAVVAFVFTAVVWVAFPPWMGSGPWQLGIPLLVVLPLALHALAWWRARRLFHTSPRATHVANLSGALGVAALVGLPWFLWASGPLRVKLFADMHRARNYSYNLEFILRFLSESFPAAPELLALGAVAAVGLAVFRKDNRGMAILCLFAVTIATMTVCGLAKSRYLLSLGIDASALAGFWVGRLPRLQRPALGVIGGMCLSALAAWTVIPGDLRIFRQPALESVTNDAFAASRGTFLRPEIPVTRAPVMHDIDEPGVVAAVDALGIKRVSIIQYKDVEPRYVEDGTLIEQFDNEGLREHVSAMWDDGASILPGREGDRMGLVGAQTLGGRNGILLLHSPALSVQEAIDGIRAHLPSGVRVVDTRTVAVDAGMQAEVIALEGAAR